MNFGLIIVIVCATVLIWRGFWGIADVYITPDNYELSSWISLLLGAAVLLYLDKAWMLLGTDPSASPQ